MSAKLKILFLNHVTFLGGAELYLASIFKHLDRSQYDAYFISQEPGDLTTEAERYNIPVELIKMRGWRKWKYILHNHRSIKKIVQFCRDKRIDVICSNCYRVTPYAAAAARKCGIPVVTIVQDFVPLKKLRNFKVFDCAQLVTVSEAIARTLREHYKGKITTVYNAIDSVAIREQAKALPPFRSSMNIPDTAQCVGLIAHVLPWKGHKLFLEAMKIVTKDHLNTVGVIVGNALYPHVLTLGDIKKYAKKIGVDERIIFTGERKDVPAVIRGIDVVVNSSSKEAFARVVGEAMALAKPVVSTRCGGPEEIIRDGETGLLVPLNDAHAMAQAIKKLLDDASMRRSMGEKGQERINAFFSPERTVFQFNDIFKDLVKGSSLKAAVS